MARNSYLINDKNRRELSECIIQIIRDAKHYIKTGNFLFVDPSITDELKEAMGRGVAVFLLSNIPELEARARQKGETNRRNTHLINIKQLHKRGAHCHSLDDLHAKFILADGNAGLLMSANFAPTSLDNNVETGIILENQELRDLEYTFDILYMNSDVYLQDSEQFHQSIRADSPVAPAAFDDQHITSNIRLTLGQKERYGNKSRQLTNLRYCKVHSIYDEILGIIDRAEDFVYIVTWHFKALDLLPELIDSLRRAINRGVWVSLFSNTEQKNDTQLKSLKQIEFLESIGCKSRGDDNNHSKCVISESEGIVFTANIDGIDGLKTGFEIGCVLHDDELNKAREYVNQLIG